jgi:hypothetical protein
MNRKAAEADESGGGSQEPGDGRNGFGFHGGEDYGLVDRNWKQASWQPITAAMLHAK